MLAGPPVQMPVNNAYADVFSDARGLHFRLSLHLDKYCVCARSDGSGQSAHKRRVASACDARLDAISSEIAGTAPYGPICFVITYHREEPSKARLYVYRANDRYLSEFPTRLRIT